MAQNTYEIVAKTIVEQMEQGVAPWRKEWLANGYTPLSLSSRKRYNGTNYMLLSFSAMARGYASPWWGTYKQITEMGGGVRKGEKGTPVVLYKSFNTEDANGKEKKAVVMRYFTVFNAEQAEWENGAPEYEKVTARETTAVIESADRILRSYFGRTGSPRLGFGGDRAYYSPSQDVVQLPEQATFYTDEAFYATAFHEMGHSTGHAKRLGREGVVENHYFGSALYSEEELVAEFTAAFLSSETGVLPSTLENSTAYIQGWLKVLKNDPKILVRAIGRAQKATNYILGVETDSE